MDMRRIGAIGLTLAMTLTMLTSCNNGTLPATSGSQTPSGSQSSAPSNVTREPVDLSVIADPYQAMAGIPGDTVVATVGGKEITADQFLYHAGWIADSFMSSYSMYGIAELPWDTEVEGVTLEQSIKSDALQTAALYNLVGDIAAEDGIALDETQILDAMSVLESMKAELGSEQALDYSLWAEGLTQDLYERLVRATVAYAQIQNEYFGENGTMLPDDETLIAYAEDALGYYKTKHILFKTVDTAQYAYDESGNATGFLPLDEATVAAQRERAESVLAQLQGASDLEATFDKLMLEYSEDTANGVVNGVDGYTAGEGQMVSGYETASYALKAGELSGVVESEYGYHIILRLPLDMDEGYLQYYISDKMVSVQQDWLDNANVVEEDVLAQIDVQAYYEGLTELRTAVDEVIYPAEESDPNASQPAG